MKQCEYPGCYSYAINQTSHGREAGVDTHLCDVCYWRTRAELAKADGYREGVKAALERAQGCFWGGDDPAFNTGVRVAINAIKKLLDEVNHA